MASRGFGDGQERAPIVRVAVEKPIGRLRIGGLNLRSVVERPARRLGHEVVEGRGAVEAEALDLLAAQPPLEVDDDGPVVQGRRELPDQRDCNRRK